MLKLTVILPTYNRLDQLKLVLNGLEQQIYPLDQFEVIVVSDGSTDGTDAYLQNLKTPLQLNPISQQNNGAAAARNTGIEQATSELILFIDDDVVPAPKLINEHMLVHESSDKNIVVIGPMLTPADFDMQPWVTWEQTMLYKQYDDMRNGVYEPTARQFYTGNTSLTRQSLIDAGGFDTQFRRAEDVELAYRLADQGLTFIFCSEAIGYHYAARSFKSWFKIPYEYGRNDVIFALEKEQPWILEFTFQTFLGRNIFVILLTWLFLDRSRISKVSKNIFRFTAWIGSVTHINSLAKASYSAIYNFQYYQGVSDQLGGRNRFFENVNKARASNKLKKKEDTSRRGVGSVG